MTYKYGEMFVVDDIFVIFSRNIGECIYKSLYG